MRPTSSYFRHTKIIATLGPATQSKEMLSKLIVAGVDILRLNMAHASHQWVDDAMWFIREASTEVDRQVAVMMDVKGPEIRTGNGRGNRSTWRSATASSFISKGWSPRGTCRRSRSTIPACPATWRSARRYWSTAD